MADGPLAEDPNVRRRKLGAELRRRREEADLRQRAAADQLDWSLSKLIRIETGAHSVSVSDLKAMLDAYKVTDAQQVGALVAAARGSRGQAWWNNYRDIVSPQFARYLGHEGAANGFRIFHPFLVPGLLHTREYATALLGVFPGVGKAQRLVNMRMERQQRVLSQAGLNFTFIMGEEALYRWVGGPRVMRHQLEHLLNIGDNEHAAVKIIPFTVGAYPGLLGPFIMLALQENDENIVFLESAGGDQLIRDDPDKISEYAEYFEMLIEMSLPSDEATNLLRENIDKLSHAEKMAIDSTLGR